MVVLRWCFCSGFVVVFWCIYCAGGVFVLVFLNIAQSSTEVMVFLRLCFCGGVFCGDVVVVFLWWCGGVSVVVWWCF